MEKNTSKVLIALVIGLVVGYFLTTGGKMVGGTVENFPTKFINGLYAGVSDQFAVSSTGAVTTGALASGAITSTGNFIASKTSTTTLSVGNTGTGKLCLWNGTNYSILSFTSNSTSTAIATSTTCN